MEKLLDTRRGSKPLYIQVKDSLLKSITDGAWQPEELIPSETELMRTFEVSRMTIRQAVGELVTENILTRKSGVGTKVLHLPTSDERFFTSIKSFSSEVRETGFTPQTFYTQLHTISPDEELRQLFGKQLEKKKLFRLDRVRGYNDKKIVYFETFLCTDIELSDVTMDKGFSLYRFFEQSGCPLCLIEERISARMANAKIARLLDVEVGEAVLLRKRFAADSNGTLTEYSMGYYDSKDYDYRISLVDR